jgi:hypothetical protein
MVQKYLPEIVQGDKRVLVIGGEPVPFCLARIPQGSEIRGNLAAGGKGVAQPLSERDREIATALGPMLAARGLLLVGLDVIGDSLTEINVTSPTCFQEITAADRLRRGQDVHRRAGGGAGMSLGPAASCRWGRCRPRRARSPTRAAAQAAARRPSKQGADLRAHAGRRTRPRAARRRWPRLAMTATRWSAWRACRPGLCGSGNFTALHLVTACHAMRVLGPSSTTSGAALRWFWQAWATAVVAAGLKPLPAARLQPWTASSRPRWHRTTNTSSSWSTAAARKSGPTAVTTGAGRRRAPWVEGLALAHNHLHPTARTNA